MCKVTIFSAPWCSPCRLLKRELDENYIEYNEVDCSTTEGRSKAMLEEVSSVPTVIVNGTKLTGSANTTLNKIKGLL